MKKLAVFALAFAAAASAQAIQGTIRTDKGSQTGDIKWQPREKSYALTAKSNGANLSLSFPVGDVTSLDIPKPANYDRLVDMVRNKQGGSAIKGLTDIVSTYRMLVWDKPAARYLVQAYLDSGKAQEAFNLAKKIIDEDKTAAYTGDLAPAYWQTLLKLNKKTQLENCLRMAASAGDRASSAQALLMRGDVIIADGADSPDAHRKALTDAYLRVALMYNDPECTDARRDAMLRCAASFDKLGYAARAEGMRSNARSL